MQIDPMHEGETMETETLQKRAMALYLALECRRDEAGEPIYRDGTPVYTLADGSPEWMRDVVYECHDDMLPDDWRYAFINEAAGALADCDDPDDVMLEPDVYYSELLAWVSSRLSRSSYCDEAESEYGIDAGTDLMTRISCGQSLEKNEVLYTLRAALEGLD